MLKTRVEPNTSSTLNVTEMVTLTKLQQEGKILWAQIIYSHPVSMTRTKAVTSSMLDNIRRILAYIVPP